MRRLVRAIPFDQARPFPCSAMQENRPPRSRVIRGYNSQILLSPLEATLMRRVILKLAGFMTGLLLLQAPAAPGQDRIPASFSWSNDATMDGIAIPVIPAAPFSATVEVETTHHLPDGTTLTQKRTSKIARDFRGRTRQENELPLPAANGTKLTQVALYDPDTRIRTLLFPASHNARQIVPGGPFQRAVETTNPPPDTLPLLLSQNLRSLVTIQSENLGIDFVDHMEVQHARQTQTFPEMLIGNDKPIIVVLEYWFSPELQVFLRANRDDPRSGSQMLAVKDLRREEPDDSLFQIPPDYKLVEGDQPVRVN